MLLCVDIGNTHTVFGLTDISNGFEFKHFRVMTRHDVTSDEFSLAIFNILSYLGISVKEVNSVVVSSVVPEVDIQFKNATKQIFGIEPVFFNFANIPMKIDYKNPYEIGSDRLVDALGALRIYGNDVLIVDTGTATTIDVVIGGVYQGGAIMPGLIVSLNAIFQKASKIPKISLDVPKSVIGKTTEECLRVGIILGISRAVDGIIEDILNHYPEVDFKVILTGGMVDKLSSLVKFKHIVDKNLIMKGLKILYMEEVLKYNS